MKRVTRKNHRVNRRHHNDPLSLVDALKGLPRVTCFNPDKVRYRSRKAAETAAEKQWNYDKRILYAYPCGDHYHLTSQKPGTRTAHGHRSNAASA